MIRVSELKHAQINIVFYESERKEAMGTRDMETAGGEILDREARKRRILRISS